MDLVTFKNIFVKTNRDSLMATLPAGRQGLGTDYKDARCTEKPGKSV